eukprot:TRINITY_DN7662_c0_g1_i1.p1 TRINITY_DN7662_c0_g1~~TRINITY_DN7662_c0_g1_i1.p1  ORF type:complete len:538 (+),score=108.17 TRINITY_DN7662_c0_g1_i1:202-1815(+)
MTDTSYKETGLPDPKKMVEEALASKDPTNSLVQDLLVAQLAGSFAFNLNLPSSDHDYFGVYLTNIDNVLGTILQPKLNFDGHEPYDHQIYELQFYLELLLKGNPKVIEPLFAPRRCYKSTTFLQFAEEFGVKVAKTQQTVKQYIGFAVAQIKDKKGDVVTNPKPFYHALRLLLDAKCIVTSGVPQVWLEGEEHEFLMSIRRGEFEGTVADLEKRCRKLRKYIDKHLSKLSPIVNRDELSDWLVSVRMRQLESYLASSTTNRSKVSFQVPENKITKQALQSTSKPGSCQLLCCYVTGSRMHGNNVKGSIADIVCVYAEPISTVFRMHPLPTTVPATKSVTIANGIVFIELSYFCTLLIQGNHRAFELLYIDHPDHIGFESDLWKQLKQDRAKFITKPVFQHYLGVAQGIIQKNKLSTSDPNVLGQSVGLATIFAKTAKRIVRGEPPLVDLRHDGRDEEGIRRIHTELTDLRRTDAADWKDKINLAFEQVNGELQELKQLKSADLDVHLLEPPKSLLNAWLIETRKVLHLSRGSDDEQQ